MSNKSPASAACAGVPAVDVRPVKNEIFLSNYV